MQEGNEKSSTTKKRRIDKLEDDEKDLGKKALKEVLKNDPEYQKHIEEMKKNTSDKITKDEMAKREESAREDAVKRFQNRVADGKVTDTDKKFVSFLDLAIYKGVIQPFVLFKNDDNRDDNTKNHASNVKNSINDEMRRGK